MAGKNGKNVVPLPDLGERRARAEHVIYEIKMFRGVLHEARKCNLTDCSTVSNALVESFLLHTRVLFDFFWPFTTKPDGQIAATAREDDLVAHDFFAHEDESLRGPIAKDWSSNLAAARDILDPMHRAIDKHLAHLTTKRLGRTEEERQWFFGAIAAAMESVIGEFVAQVPEADALGFAGLTPAGPSGPPATSDDRGPVGATGMAWPPGGSR
jgi:hypothetical protein